MSTELNTDSSTKITLYQFSLCPFCNKVRAALEVKGIPYAKVEVTPGNKKELPELPEDTPKKVPVLKVETPEQTVVIQDSTAILKYIESRFAQGPELLPEDKEAQERVLELEEWIDAEFIQALPTVIYGTRQEAAQATKVVAREAKLGLVKRFGMRLVGSLIMRKVAQRLLERHGKTDGHVWVQENIDQFSRWLGEGPYVAGDSLSMADVAMQGAMTCVKEFPIFQTMMQTPNVAEWYQRVDAQRRPN